MVVSATLFVALFAFAWPECAASQKAYGDDGAQPAQAENQSRDAPDPVAHGAAQQNSSKRQGARNWQEYIPDKPSDWLLVLFNAMLALFTWRLWISTAKLYQVTKVAADAADRSARAAIGVQLPILRVMPDKLGFGDIVQGGEQSEHCSVHRVTIFNLGETKAFPMEILYGFTFGDSLPDQPSYQFGDKFPPNFILEPTNSIAKNLSAEFRLKKAERERILLGNCLWFYCCILYNDFMDERRTHGFCWRWSYVGGGLDWRADSAAAYNRKT